MWKARSHLRATRGDLLDEFDRLPQDKRGKVLEASIKEFAEKGYTNASTNAIVREAGVSKGLLFHYFRSKRDLYLAALDYCLNVQMDYFLQNARLPYPSDVIERVIEWGALKLEMVYRFPLMHRLLLNALLEMPSEVRSEVEKRFGAITQRSWQLFLQGVDLSQLRDGIDKRKAVELLVVAMEGLQRKYVDQYKDRPGDLIAGADKVLEEVKQYMEILKYGLYAVR